MNIVVKAYNALIKDKDFDFNKIGTSEFPIPKFTQKYLMDLCTSATNELNKDPVLLKLSGDFVIVGDLHGNIKDLLRIFSSAGSPLVTNYLFLGDYVDRGQFSIEVITLLLALKQLRPAGIFLLRGNHEFEEMNSIYGFREQVLNEYSHELFRAFNKAFAALPIACILNEKTFIVHGGISKYLKSIDQIATIPKPMARFNGTPYNDLIIDLMWSDPSKDYKQFGPSPRGTGSAFGADALKAFLAANKMKRIIRAHQCVINGVENFCKDKLLTVFSSSNYSAEMANKSGIVKILLGQTKCFNFKPLNVTQRERTVFKIITMETVFPSNDDISEQKSNDEKKSPRTTPISKPQKTTPTRQRGDSFSTKSESPIKTLPPRRTSFIYTGQQTTPMAAKIGSGLGSSPSSNSSSDKFRSMPKIPVPPKKL